MIVRTPEELEDAAITDAIRSIVGMRTRAQHRDLQNRIVGMVQPKLEMARLQGKRVNVKELMKEVLDETATPEG